jgi:Flp pilus assembly protein TadB
MTRLLFLLMATIAALWLSLIVRRIIARERELRRFQEGSLSWWGFLVTDIRRFIQFRVALRRERQERDNDLEFQRLVQAGLESFEARERYYLFKDVSIVCAILICALSVAYYPLVISCVIILAAVCLGFWGPRWWLWQKWTERQQRLEREMPFLLESLCLGTAIGWEPVRVFDKLADTLGEEEPGHPLVRELRRAQWFASTGGTWIQGLGRVRSQVGNRDVGHSIGAVMTALAADGSKHELLLGIANEAHGTYVARLESRATILPLIALAVTCALVFGFILMIRIPLF